MATYYVSQQNGADGNTGLIGFPWETLTHALATLVAGDKLYIGPGTYRETTPLTFTNEGTSGSPIEVVWDPDAEFLTADDPGLVRITATDVDEAHQGGWVLEAGDYVYLGSLTEGGWCHVDGGYGGGVIRVDSDKEQYNYKILCMAQDAAFTDGISEMCIGIGAYGFSGGEQRRCIGIGSINAFSTSDRWECLALGSGSYSFIFGHAYNCMAVGTQRGFMNVTTYNCVALACYHGFYGANNYEAFAVCCAYIATGAVLHNCRSYLSGGTTTCTGDAVVVSPGILLSALRMLHIFEAFEPILNVGMRQWGNTDATMETYDVLGHVWNLAGGSIDVGLHSLTNYSLDWTYATSENGLKMVGAGERIFKVPARNGVALTITCMTMWEDEYTGDKPQIILRGLSIATQTDTNASAEGSWEQLSVSATPAKDEELELVLKARDTGTPATLTTALAGSNNDMVFTAKSGGAFGNQIAIEYYDPSANNSPLAITIDYSTGYFAIKVSLATDGSGTITSTAAEIKTAMEAHEITKHLLTIADYDVDDGSGVVPAVASAALTGGVDALAYFAQLETS